MQTDEGGTAAVVMVVDGREVVVWEPPAGVRPDITVIDRLARLQLEARRNGYVLRLRNPCPDMLAMIRLVGLSRVFGVIDDEVAGRLTAAARSVEVVGQAQRGEERGVEEVVQPDELPVGDLDDL